LLQLGAQARQGVGKHVDLRGYRSDVILKAIEEGSLRASFKKVRRLGRIRRRITDAKTYQLRDRLNREH
jgi:hypothetical protein